MLIMWKSVHFFYMIPFMLHFPQKLNSELLLLKLVQSRLSLDIKLYFITNLVNRWHKNVSFCREKKTFQLTTQNQINETKYQHTLLSFSWNVPGQLVKYTYFIFIKYLPVMKISMWKYSTVNPHGILILSFATDDSFMLTLETEKK